MSLTEPQRKAKENGSERISEGKQVKGSLEVEKKGGEISPTEQYIDFYINQ